MDPDELKTAVCSAEVTRHFAEWQDRAALHPVYVTHHGRERTVLISAARYRDLITNSLAEPLAVEANSSESLEQLSERLDEGFIALDSDLTMMVVNAKAADFLGRDRDKLIGQSLREQVPGVEASLGYAGLVRAAKAGSFHTFEMPSLVRSGHWLLVSTFPLAGGVACLFRDITTALEARREAEAESAMLLAVAAHGRIGQAQLTDTGVLIDADQAFAGFTGYKPAGLHRAKLEELISPNVRTTFAAELKAALDGRVQVTIETTLLMRDDRERDVRIQLVPAHRSAAAAAAIVVMTDRDHLSA